MVETPTVIEALQLHIKLQGDNAAIQGGLLLGGGKVDITGNLGYNPETFIELNLLGERETLLFPPSTQLLLSHNIKLMATANYLEVSGDLIVHEGVLEHEELPEGAVALSEDVVVVGYVGPQPRPFDLGMDVQVAIEDQFKVVGSVVDVTVGGNLHLLQVRGRPLQLFGNLNVVGGELRAYGQHLKVKRGTLAFSGAPENPTLDMRAERIIARENITVGVELNGTLEDPVLEVYSDPVLSNTESLSYLVRGRGLDAGAGADGTALAVSMGASIVNQTGVLGNLDKVPGISGVEIGAQGADDDTTATVSGYLGSRIYLSYGVGLYEPINVLTARLYLQTQLWLEVVSSLENSLDLYYSFDIE
jgi:autotransporter translocation and assembly factor TamB